jgi:hypothetical protein
MSGDGEGELTSHARSLTSYVEEISGVTKIEGCRNPTPTLNAPITTTTIASGSTSIPYGEEFSGTEEVIAPLYRDACSLE